MKIKTLHIQNFMSIQQVNMELDNKGMTLILGENLDNQDFDNNGAGKSTITEALTYVLYGKTLRGLKGDEIVNKTSKRNCKVMLDLTDDDGTEYRFSRYRKHKDNGNKFFLFRNGKDITPKSESDFTQAIVNILNMDFLTFTSSILYSAQSFKFTTATDAEMKNAFDTMLGLDFYSKCAGEVKEQLKQLNFQQQSLNAELTNLEQQSDSLNEQITKYSELQTSYEDEKEEQLDELSDIISKQKSELLHCNNAIVKILKEIESAQKLTEAKKLLWKKAEKSLEALDEIKQGIDNCKDELRDNQALESKANAQIDTYKSKIEMQESSIKTYNIRIDHIKQKIEDSISTVGSPCPVCGNAITESSIESVLNQYNTEIEDYANSRDESQKVIDGLEIKIQNLQSQVDELCKVNEDIKKDQKLLESSLKKGSNLSQKERNARFEYDESNSLMMQLNLDYKNLQMKEDRVTVDITNSENLLAKKQKESNPYTELIEDTYRSQQALIKKCEEIKKSLSLLGDDELILNFWQQGFSNSGIKSLLLDDITPFLNRRANKYLRKLSSDHMEINFSTQSTLKSGDMREKFNIEITNDDGGNTYTANSSGEKRRIDIAVNLALQDLIASRSNKKLNIAFFDEVFDTLDAVGVEKVVDLLQDMSKDKSSLFVITHNNDLKSLFTNSIKIVKKGGYSTLVEG